MGKILVTGGAGYIGSHMVSLLAKRGLEVIILDDLSNSHQSAIFNHQLIKGNCGDKNLLNQIFQEHQIDAIMHFASFINVADSVQNPKTYYQNNVENSLILLDAMIENQVQNFIFSSTAAVYGHPQYLPIDEQHPCQPINPYGDSKYIIEQKLIEHSSNHGLNYGILRYFNAAGAHPNLNIGEQHNPETHLIPLILQAALHQTTIKIFGNDYNTADGTAIRDYIHVCDLCDAHLKLLEYIKSNGKQTIFNLGGGQGHSVLEIIKIAEQITGKNIQINYQPRRAGDPQSLIANHKNAQEILGWQAQYDISQIIQHAWQFILRHD